MRRAAARVLAAMLAMLSLVSLGGCTPLTVLAVLDGCYGQRLVFTHARMKHLQLSFS